MTALRSPDTMPMKMDVTWPARRLKMELGNDPIGDKTAQHSESGGARSVVVHSTEARVSMKVPIRDRVRNEPLSST